MQSPVMPGQGKRGNKPREGAEPETAKYKLGITGERYKVAHPQKRRDWRYNGRTTGVGNQSFWRSTMPWWLGRFDKWGGGREAQWGEKRYKGEDTDGSCYVQ